MREKFVLLKMQKSISEYKFEIILTLHFIIKLRNSKLTTNLTILVLSKI